MKEETLDTIINFCIANDAELTLTLLSIKVFINFNEGDRYKDTFVDEGNLYFWNYMFNNWNVIPVKEIIKAEFVVE